MSLLFAAKLLMFFIFHSGSWAQKIHNTPASEYRASQWIKKIKVFKCYYCFISIPLIRPSILYTTSLFSPTLVLMVFMFTCIWLWVMVCSMSVCMRGWVWYLCNDNEIKKFSYSRQLCLQYLCSLFRVYFFFLSTSVSSHIYILATRCEALNLVADGRSFFPMKFICCYTAKWVKKI